MSIEQNGMNAAIENKTLVTKLLEAYKANPEICHPVTMGEYMYRMQMVPRLASKFAESELGFTEASDLPPMVLRLVTGFMNYRYHSISKPEEMEKEVSLPREMLLLAYEAKPRHISFAMNGYTASDFIAYIYQDVARRSMGLEEDETKLPFQKIVNDIKDWLRIPPESGTQNSARRHIRRRLMLLLDRSNHQAASLFEDREMPSDLVALMQKLLERDDDVGYTQGELRPFREVRHDFNILAEHCLRLRKAHDDMLEQRLNKVICPSLVDDFATYEIDFPRGRYVNGKPYRINRDGDQKRTSAAGRKTIDQSKPKGKPGRKPKAATNLSPERMQSLLTTSSDPAAAPAGQDSLDLLNDI